MNIKKEIKKSAIENRNIIFYASVIIVTVFLADIKEAWGENWPALVILVMSSYILMEPFKPLVRKNKKAMLIFMAVLFCFVMFALIVLGLTTR